MTLVATQVKRRRGTTAENDAFTGAEGEIVVDTERHELRVHDGVTQGGHIIPTNDTLDFANKALDNLSQEGEARFTNKANVNMDNITSAGKETVVGWGMPDYTSGVAFSNNTNYTAPSDGFVIASGWTNLSTNSSFYLNGTRMASFIAYTNAWLPAIVYSPVHKGDVIKINFTQGTYTMNFYPLKGV